MAEDFFTHFVEMWRTGDAAIIDELFTPDLVYHITPFPDMDLEDFKQFVTYFHRGFPGIDVVKDGEVHGADVSAYQWTASGVFKGPTPLLPLPPTGRSTYLPGAHFIHWRNGRAAEV